MGFYRKIKRKVVFWVGDIHRLSSFPYVSWSHRDHRVSYGEVLEMLPDIKFGDVGIHRDSGYMSNFFIPGFMKHGWIHTEDGVSTPKIVEAVSEGVLRRSPMYPLYSDYSIVLSPKDVTDEERKGACVKANGIVGAEYDEDFDFDIEEELKFYTGDDKEDARVSLEHASHNLKKKYGFSCTETVSYAWWHKRQQLRLYRKKRMGRECILADDFLNGAWEIKWMSKSVTPDVARKHKLHEEGLQMISDFHNS